MKTTILTAAWGAMLSAIIGTSAFAADPIPFKEASSCGDYGTSIHFESTPSEAAKQAKKDGRLVMVLHISGHFEDPALT